MAKCGLQGGVLAYQASFFTIPHPCLFLPPLTKQSAPKKAGVIQPLLIWSPSIGDSREGKGYVANPPTYGHPRRQG